MSKIKSPETKSARLQLRLITAETERVLDNTFRHGFTITRLRGLQAQVALGVGLPLGQVEVAVRAYVKARQDLSLVQGRIRRKV